jgi:hypothetical protein
VGFASSSFSVAGAWAKATVPIENPNRTTKTKTEHITAFLILTILLPPFLVYKRFFDLIAVW